MSPKAQQLHTYVDATAEAIGLPLPPEYRASVAEHVATLLALGELVMSVPLPPELESAQVFRP